MSNQAQIDLRDKMMLEIPFRREIDAFGRRVVREYVTQLADEGLHRDANEQWDEFLVLLLFRQYRRVGRIFGKRTGPRLPASLRTTPEEQSAINLALRRRFSLRAPEQAGIINGTTQRQMQAALAAALAAASRLFIESGQQLTRPEVAAQAGVNLGRGIEGRKGSIVTLETQAPAELSKLVETDILVGVPPERAATPSTIGTTVKKGWVTMGDRRVRHFDNYSGQFSHVMADGQIKKETEPFVVTGELLMYPGDTSLGASIGNVIRCRCASVPELAAIAELRRRANRRGERIAA